VLLGGGGITLADGRTVLHANRRVTLAERPLKSGGQQRYTA